MKGKGEAGQGVTGCLNNQKCTKCRRTLGACAGTAEQSGSSPAELRRDPSVTEENLGGTGHTLGTDHTSTGWDLQAGVRICSQILGRRRGRKGLARLCSCQGSKTRAEFFRKSSRIIPWVWDDAGEVFFLYKRGEKPLL